MTLRIAVIAASVRRDSQSERIAKIVRDTILERAGHRFAEENGTGTGTGSVAVDIINFAEQDLPFWTEEFFVADSMMRQAWQGPLDTLRAADGFVIICPEWGGMATPHLKNMLLIASNGEMAHKPAFLIGISAGMSGAYPLSELRASGYKNTFVMWLPDQMILRNVGDVFTAQTPTALDDELMARLEYSLRFLLEIAQVMAPVRERCQDLDRWRHGM